MKIVDKGVLDASFMDFSTPSEFARSALYYCPQFGHYEYLLSYRLKQSKQMLIGSQNTVEQIAELCGFNSASHFTRAFRGATGSTAHHLKFKKCHLLRH